MFYCLFIIIVMVFLFIIHTLDSNLQTLQPIWFPAQQPHVHVWHVFMRLEISKDKNITPEFYQKSHVARLCNLFSKMTVFYKPYKIAMQKWWSMQKCCFKGHWFIGLRDFLSPFSAKSWAQIPPLPEGAKNESPLRSFPLTSLSEHHIEW